MLTKNFEQGDFLGQVETGSTGIFYV